LLVAIRRINILNKTGCAREIPVFGFINGCITVGVIVSPEILGIADCRMSFDQTLYIQKTKIGLKRPSYPYEHNNTVHLLDFRTTGKKGAISDKNPPSGLDGYKVQLMLYRELLNAMILAVVPLYGMVPSLTYPLVFSEFFVATHMDPDAPFGQESRRVLKRLAGPSFAKIGHGFPADFNDVASLRDVVGIWAEVVKDMGLGDPTKPSQGRISEVLTLHFLAATDTTSMEPDPDAKRNRSGGRSARRSTERPVADILQDNDGWEKNWISHIQSYIAIEHGARMPEAGDME
jgi:hypothetical protein